MHNTCARTHIHTHSQQLVSEAGEPYIPTEGRLDSPHLPGEEEERRKREEEAVGGGAGAKGPYLLFFFFGGGVQ